MRATFNCVQMVKADAAAFLRMVNRTRCLDKISGAMADLEKKGHRGFILHREIKSIGRILGTRQRVPRTHRYISFTEVRRAIQFLKHDKFFATGGTIWERLDGLAMGAATSPAITVFDLDTHSRRVFTDKAWARQVGVHTPGLSTTRSL
jgi:hypothetical protein